MIRRSLPAALLSVAFVACAPGLHLERSPGRAQNLDDLWPCVRTATQEVESGKALSPEEEKALGGRDVSGFLFWDSFSGPRPVVREGRPSEVERSLFSGDERVTQRYVLCLLRSGYEWPPTASPSRP